MTKTITVSRLYCASLARIDAEIAKCRLICALCHRAHTLEQKRARLLPRAKKPKVA